MENTLTRADLELALARERKARERQAALIVVGLVALAVLVFGIRACHAASVAAGDAQLERWKAGIGRPVNR